jgi:hypothetical protein
MSTRNEAGIAIRDPVDAFKQSVHDAASDHPHSGDGGSGRGGACVTSSWMPDWAWGLPLLTFTVVVHVCALLITAMMLLRGGPLAKASHFVIFVAIAALAASVYLALDAAAWALLYLFLGASADWRAAMLYSLGAITSYGHASVFLEDRWQLLGAIEAVNGMILFGLTTAFLFAAIERVWPLRGRLT